MDEAKKEEAPAIFGDEKAPETKEEPKEESGKETPTQVIARLSQQIGELTQYKADSERRHKEKDDNIRAMREALDKRQRESREKDDDTNDDAPFKEIKWSKDLSEEEREEMTEMELKQMDAIATMQTQINALSKKEKQTQTKETDASWKETVRTIAKELAGDNVDLANKILTEAQKFSYEGLDAEGIKERVITASRLVSEYKPPKEQQDVSGRPAGGGSSDDPYGVGKIVAEVAKGKDTNTYEL